MVLLSEKVRTLTKAHPSTKGILAPRPAPSPLLGAICVEIDTHHRESPFHNPGPWT